MDLTLPRLALRDVQLDLFQGGYGLEIMCGRDSRALEETNLGCVSSAASGK